MAVIGVGNLKVLKIKITAPSAHFRVIHSNDPRKSYPVPPYSTAIGFLANILGEQEKIQKLLSVPFGLGILSRYQYISREYTWMRNMAPIAHKNRFISIDNRIWQEQIEHPGGQSPITVDVLNEVEIFLYISHPNTDIISCFKKNINKPEKWLSHLHLGRAEDWAIIEEINITELFVSNAGKDIRNASRYYQWMPEPKYAVGLGEHINPKDYIGLYKKMQGNAVLITSLYQLVEVSYKDNKNKLIRNFDHIPGRLCSSQVPFLDSLQLPALFVDEEIAVPVYMCLIDPIKRKGGLADEADGANMG